MLIKRPFEMELCAALIIRGTIEAIECHTNCARDLGACLRVEKCVASLDVKGRTVKARLYQPRREKVAGRRKSRERK